MRAILTTRNYPEQREKHQPAMITAAEDLIRGGCIMVWDSSTDNQSQQVLENAGLWHFMFHEVLGLTKQRAEPILNAALNHIQSKPPSGSHLGDGLNPHAPYSVGPWLRDRLRTLPIEIVQAWHLSETRDEEELFESGHGSIAEFYSSVGLQNPFQTPPRCSSFQYLQRKQLLERCSVAFHGNRLASAEAAFFSAPRAIVHCPATHQWFMREPVPIKNWITSGSNVCLGTDSLASAESLSMIEALQIMAESHSDLSTDDLLTMACFNPLQCGIIKDNRFTGTLSVGSSANFVSLSPASSPVAWSNFFQTKPKVQQCWISGSARI